MEPKIADSTSTEIDDLYYTPADPNMPHILDSIPDLSTYKSFTERYFTKRYILNAKGVENNDLMIMFHSNRVALLCLAPSHFFFKKTGDYKVNFSGGNVDRLKNTVKGKGKKGGQYLHPESVICKLEFEDGSSFNIPCGMKGSLIEVNENLLTNPQLIRQYPDADGYLAIILSSIANSEATKDDLLTHEEYVQSINCSNNVVE